jgi:hypothetical protein
LKRTVAASPFPLSCQSPGRVLKLLDSTYPTL